MIRSVPARPGVRAVVLASLLAVIALMAPARASAAPSGFVRMSNERSHTLSSEVLQSAWVRRSPRRGAARVGRIGTTTWHGSPEVVLLLGELNTGRRRWSYVRYAGLGDRRGWVPSSVLSSITLHTARLVLNRARLRLELFRGKRLLFKAPVGIGARSSPTPAGRYYIRERLGPFASSNSVYGVLAFGLSAFSRFRTDWPSGGQVGLHGTNEPGLIPGRISNGCIRLANRDVRRLGRVLKVGTPLLIR